MPQLNGRITPMEDAFAVSRDAGNPPVRFDVAGAGDGVMEPLNGHEAGNGGHSQGASCTPPRRSPTRLAGYPDYTLNSYGSYETAFLRRVTKGVGRPAMLAELLSRSHNVLSTIRRHVYVPTYSNGLKDVAPLLGFTWFASFSTETSSASWVTQLPKPNRRPSIAAQEKSPCFQGLGECEEGDSNPHGC